MECAPFTQGPYYSERPILIADVLFESTERADRSDKYQAHRRLASLMEYLLVAQDERRVEIYRRGTGWELEVCGEGQGFHLAAIGSELGVDAIYQDIHA